jgi:PKD repeat protein
MVNPIPVFSLGADTSICQGNSLVLSQPVTGASVLWNNGSVDDTLLVNNAGTYSCNLTLNGCSYADSIQVSIDSLPIANFGYSISNSTITLTDSSMYGTTYKWYFGDGDSSTLSAPTHIYATNGNYTVTQIVYNPCGTDTFKRTISIITGIIEQQISSIMIYPNPTSNVLNIDLKDQLKDHVSIYLIDMKGDLLYRKQFHQADQIIPIDVHDLPAGTYLLRVATGDQIFVQRVMISK